MKKIAIKYSEENWANVKVAVDLIRSTGQTVIKRKDSVLLEGVTALRNNWGITPGKFDYSEVSITAMYEEGFTILSMPEDMDKLKEALGIEVPKNGEVYDIVGRVVRFKSKINGKMADLHSQLLDDGTFYAESKQINFDSIEASKDDYTKAVSVLMCLSPSPVITGKKSTKQIILNQYEAIEILVDDFEMSHGDGKILVSPKPTISDTLKTHGKKDAGEMLRLREENKFLSTELKRAEDHILENSHEVVDLQKENKKLKADFEFIRFRLDKYIK